MSQHYGIRGPAALRRLKQPFPVQFTADLMHNAANVDKSLRNLIVITWLDQVPDIAHQLRDIRAPTEFPRRCIKNLAYPEHSCLLKSHERLVRLTSGVYKLALLGNVPREHFDLFSRLCSVFKRLAASVVPRDELPQLERDASEVYVAWLQLTPDVAHSLQLHLLVHLPGQIALVGALPQLWAFKSEAALGDMMSRTHATTKVEPAIINKWLLRAAVRSQLPEVGPTTPGEMVGEDARFYSTWRHALQTTEVKGALHAACARLGLQAPAYPYYRRYDHASIYDLHFRNPTADGKADGTLNSGMQVFLDGREQFGVVQSFDTFESPNDATAAAPCTPPHLCCLPLASRQFSPTPFSARPW